jgi:hypothetical protein
MKHFFYLLYLLPFTFSLISCHTQRAVCSVDTEQTDLALTHSESKVSVYTDSLIHSLSLAFDTLDIWMEATPNNSIIEDKSTLSAVRIRAVRGSLIANQQQVSSATASVFIADSANVDHSENIETNLTENATSVYHPPNLNWILAVALIIAAAIILYRIRNKS